MRRLLAALVASFIAALLRVLRWTWRVQITGGPVRPGRVHAFWHGDQLALAASLAGDKPMVLVSRSRDGEVAARAAALLGFATARGSSHRGAVAGARALVRELRTGGAVAIAADGPRGPRHRCGDSALRLARLGGQPEVIPVAAAARRACWLQSWDRLCVPAPFTRVEIVFGGAVQGQLEASLDAVSAKAAALLRVPRRRAPVRGLLLALLAILAGMAMSCGLERERVMRGLKSREATVRAEALSRLGSLRDPSLGDLAIPFLKDSSPRVRRSAVAALGSLGLGSRQRRALVERLHDGDLEVRLAVVRVLGDSGDQRAREPLLDALEDDSPIVRAAAALALRGLGLDGPAQARQLAGKLLAEQIKRLGHADEQVAASAAQLLGASERTEALQPIVKRLASLRGAPLLGRELVQALGRLGGASARLELLARAARGEPVLRAAAIAALARLGGANQAILGLARDPMPEVRRAVLLSLDGERALSEGARATICRALLDEDEAVAQQAARLLRLHDGRCAEADRALTASRWRVIAELPGPAATAALVRLVGQRTEEYSEQAARWIPAGRWAEVGDGGEPEPDPDGPPARRPDPAKRSALEKLLRRFPERLEGAGEDPLLPPSVDGKELLELVASLEGRPQARELLLRLASGAGPTPIRGAALRALVGVPPAVDGAASQPAAAGLQGAVRDALGSTEVELRRAGAEGCPWLGPEGASVAEGLLKSPGFEERVAGARCLALLQGRSSVPRLLALLEAEPHLGLIESLGRLGDRRAAPPLRRLLVAGDAAAPDERLPIIEALGSLGDAAAAPALELELGHPDGRVRRAAAVALVRCGRAASREALAICSEDFLAEVRSACREARQRLR